MVQKKSCFCSSDMRGDFRRCEGRGGWLLFLVGQAHKMCVLKIWGMDLGKRGEFSRFFFWKCCIVETLSGRLFFQMDAMGYNRCKDIQGEGFLSKKGNVSINLESSRLKCKH